VHLNPCVASAVRDGAWVRAATMDAVKHVSQIAPLAGEANCGQGTNVPFSLGARLLLTAYFDSASKSACILIRPLVTTILFFQG
jgi:hypothetical protein